MKAAQINWTKKKAVAAAALAIYEIICACLFVQYGYGVTKIIRYLVLVPFLCIMAYTDFRKRIIENRHLLAACLVRTVLLVIDMLLHTDLASQLLVSALIGTAGMFFILYLAYFISRRSMGMGDVKLGAVIGFYLGLRLAYMSLIAALLVCMIYSLVQVARKKLSLKSSIPFGPFFLAGTAFVLLLGM